MLENNRCDNGNNEIDDKAYNNIQKSNLTLFHII